MLVECHRFVYMLFVPGIALKRLGKVMRFYVGYSMGEEGKEDQDTVLGEGTVVVPF